MQQFVASPPPPEFFSAFDEGIAAINRGDVTVGESHLLRAAKISPEAWLALGVEALKDKDYDQAMRRFKEVLAVAPKEKNMLRAAAINNIGMAIANFKSREESEAYFVRAIQMVPSYADALANMGLIEKWRGNIDKAIYWFKRALDINPQHGQAEFSLATALLIAGKFREGWDVYESRWRTEGAEIRKVEAPIPEWDGENAKPGDCIMIYGEQGAGDCIQMLRYAPILRDRGFMLGCAIQAPLTRVAERMGVFSHIIEPGGASNKPDVHIPIMSLPRVCKTWSEADIPKNVPYLSSPQPASFGPGKHVGIVWKGSASFRNDLFRSTKLSDWKPLLDVPGYTFHSLQVADDTSELAGTGIVEHPKPVDYAETADRIAGLDLVVSIDTSVAHLAGAMGKPVWILLGRGGDFRWLTMDRTDSPWYPTAKLFRQQKEMIWTDLINLAADELKKGT